MTDSNPPATPDDYSLNNQITTTPLVGKYAVLEVGELLPMGALLIAGEFGNILLPNKQVPDKCAVGDAVKVFIYLDSEDRIIATCQRPRATVGQVANLEVADVNETGAFLDWGLVKDLFLPFAEQKTRVEVEQHCIVYVYMDNTDRIVATTRLNRFIKDEVAVIYDHYNPGDKVRILIAARTELGYKAVVDNKYWGLIHHSDIHQEVRVGQKVDAYVRKQRDDKRLDLSLQPIGYQKVGGLAEQIMQKVEEGNGFLPLSDKSPAELIEMHFGVSKRAFKMAIGKLYKDRKITIERTGIRAI
jgi:predicted RNA-binding protein (virulence factor B family)